MPNDERPQWASAPLAFVVLETSTDLEKLTDVIAMAADSTRWIEGHRAFQTVRQRMFKNERPGYGTRQSNLWSACEIVAKIVYNACGGPARFDYHAGWRLAPRVKAIVQRLKDLKIEDECWRLLVRGDSAQRIPPAGDHADGLSLRLAGLDEKPLSISRRRIVAAQAEEVFDGLGSEQRRGQTGAVGAWHGDSHQRFVGG